MVTWATVSIKNSEQTRWFNEEVHQHDSALKRYLRAAFPTVGEVDDVAQESYLRIWKGVQEGKPIRSAKAFLFSIARHVALDFLRRRRSNPVDAVGDLSAINVLYQGLDAAETASMNEKINILSDALATLPQRCREITMLRKLQGVPQKEIASRLGISEKTVEVQVSRGVKQCTAYVQKRGLRDLYLP